AVGRLPHFLNGRKQQTDQHRDNRNHDEELDQGEAEGGSQPARAHSRLPSQKTVHKNAGIPMVRLIERPRAAQGNAAGTLARYFALGTRRLSSASSTSKTWPSGVTI